MRSIHVGTVACGLVLVAGLAAQDRQDRPNPVRVRLTSEVYRAAQVIPDSQPGALALDCNLEGTAFSMLRVQDGQPGAHATLLVSAQPGAFHYPGVGTLLVSPDVVAVNGVFDGAGCFEQPIDLARLDLAGQAVYVQALQMSKTESVSVSEGLAMRFTPGNRQPPLYYDGPPMTAIPCKAIDEYLDQTSYTVLLEFMVRQYSDVRVIDTFAVDDQTQAVVVKLISDRMVPQGAVPMPIAPPKPLRTVLDLGPFPPPVLEVWVAYPMWAPPEAEEPPPPNADGDGRGYIICYGPDVRGDVRQSIKAEAGPGGDARDRVPTDRRDRRLPPGWCIVHARAAVVDLRY